MTVSASACADGSGDVEAYCSGLGEVVAVDARLARIDLSDPEDTGREAQRLVTALDVAATEAPSDIADDVELLALWVDAVVEAQGQLGVDPLADATRLTEAAASVPDPTAAIARIRSHGERACRLELPGA